jgi:hypothetical protein
MRSRREDGSNVAHFAYKLQVGGHRDVAPKATQMPEGDRGTYAPDSPSLGEESSASCFGSHRPPAWGALVDGLSASERAYGVHTAAQTHAANIQHLRTSLHVAEHDAEAISHTLIPGYKNARDAKDVNAVAELGGRSIGAFVRMTSAKVAADELRQAKHQSVAGSTPEQDLENYEVQQYADAHADTLAEKVEKSQRSRWRRWFPTNSEALR